MRIAFHAINGVGLGHLVRSSAIAAEVRSLVPDAALLMITNAADTSILERAGLDFVSFPPGLAEPHAEPSRARRALPAPVEHAAITAALGAFRPDLVVFDTHAPVELARYAATIGARAVLVQRELRPEVLAAMLARGGAALVDRFVIPHEPGEVQLDAVEHVPVVVTGPVVRDLDTTLPRGVQAPMVLVMAGGGGQPVDARRFLRAAADAHILARARIPHLTTLLVTGPYGDAPANLAGIEGLEVEGACAHLPALLSRAALVVSQAGYNSIAEIRALEKPAILVPGYRKAEDQRARARRLVEMGAAVMARPDARSIADRIESLLLSPSARSAMIEAHRRRPLVRANRTVAEAVLRPLRVDREVHRAVLIAHEFAPRVGGMETVAHALAAGLVARGIAVRVYTTRQLGPEVSDLPEGSVRRLYKTGIDLWGDLLVTVDALLVDAPDVVHLCNAGLAPWVPALEAAFPAAVTVHVHGNDLLAPWARHGGDPQAYRAAQVAGLSAADAVLAVSRFSGRLAKAAGARRARIRVIENSVDCTRFAPGPADAALAQRLGIAPDDEVVLTVSRLAPRKGHAVALKALALLLRERPRALYVYTGESALLSTEVASLASELGVRERVRAIGFLPESELPALYRVARVFALLAEESPSDVEGFGVSLLEAAASGLPVVATRTGGIPEAVADGMTGVLVPPGDPVAAARALAAMLGDATRAAAKGEQGRRRAVERFSNVARTGEVVDVWNAILHDHPGLRPLRGFPNSFAGGTSHTASERTRSQREALAAAPAGVALVRLAQQDAVARRAAASLRRATFARVVKRGGIVRLRAMEGGTALLADALTDCAALEHAPLVEMKLRRFMEPDFVAHALPFVRGARLVQVVPIEGGAALLDRIASLPPMILAKIIGVQLFLSRDAQSSRRAAMAAVPDARRLRQLLGARGVPVLPPPEIARYLAETPATFTSQRRRGPGERSIRARSKA